ncbi:MAG: AMP-binding protein [Gammaproteobacteria bacterium]
MDKIWLKSYPPGVPAEINPDAYQSINEIFDESCAKYADFPAYYNLGITFTYREIDQYSKALACYFQQVLRLKKGDRVAIMLPNVLQYPIVVFAALRVGLTVVNVNPLYTAPELAHQIKDAGAETIVVLANFAHTVEVALPQTPLKNIIVTHVGDFFSLPKSLLTDFFLKYIKKKIPTWRISRAIKFKDALYQGKKLTLAPVTINPHDIAFLQYTGGTTGVSKGAMLTHRNIIANILQAEAWFKPLVELGKEIILTALPLYHIFSLTANCMFMMRIGGFNILITNPRDVAHMIDEMSKFRLTVITGVNTLFNALLNHRGFSHLDFRDFKLCLGGGAAVQKAVAEKWQKVTGAPLLEAYGLTETSPCVAVNPATTKTYCGNIGLPVSSTEVCIFDDDGHPVPTGQSGELAIKGPQVMLGYWNNPRETEKVFTINGWLLTGDIASMDENGFLKILERKKDMILVSGFNVYPNEIEDVIVRMPGVIEAAVVGVPDEHSGEAIKAFVVTKDPKVTEEAIIKFCRENLTGYKIPRHIEFRDELPKSNVGKILRRKLRE